MAEVKILPSPEKDNKSEDVKYDVSHAPTPHVVHVQKSPVKSILLLLVFLVLIAGNILLGYLYYQQKQDANNLQQQIGNLQATTSTELQTEQGGDLSSSETISYSSKTGAYNLTISADYTIVENIDGDYEGGPVSDIEVANSVDTDGVVISSIPPTRVYSIPKTTSSLANFIDSQNSEYSNVVEIESITVDGVTAKVYRLSGLSDINRIFFESDNNVYMIEAGAPEGSGIISQQLQAIVDGFKFSQ
jgi:hypothetical protein